MHASPFLNTSGIFGYHDRNRRPACIALINAMRRFTAPEVIYNWQGSQLYIRSPHKNRYAPLLECRRRKLWILWCPSIRVAFLAHRYVSLQKDCLFIAHVTFKGTTSNTNTSGTNVGLSGQMSPHTDNTAHTSNETSSSTNADTSGEACSHL